MRKRIETDASWQGTVAQYVYLHIDVNKEQDKFRAWDKLFPSNISGTPHVAVVSSDGRVIHNKAGGVDVKDLAEFLTKNGKLLSAAALAQVKAAVEAAQKALDAGDVATAVSKITPVLGSGGAGEDVQKAEEFGKKLIEDAKGKFKEAEEKLASADDSLEAAVAILGMSRDYAKMKALADDLKKLRTVQNHKDHREVFEQARVLDQAAMRVATKNKKDAIAKYESVVRKWPNTPAATFAQAKLKELGSDAVIVVDTADPKSGDSKTAGTTKPTAPKGGAKLDKAVAERKAKGLLESAEVLAGINKDEAKKKAEEVVKLVPGTELAKRAEALLKKL